MKVALLVMANAVTKPVFIIGFVYCGNQSINVVLVKFTYRATFWGYGKKF